MFIEGLRLVVALALLVVLPGWLLLRAVFPDPSKVSVAETVYLTLGGGIFVLMSVGLTLGFLPHGDRGHFQSFAAGGMPNVELLTAAVCMGLFWAGARRGAYPRIAAKYPRLVAPWASSKPAEQ